MKRLAIFAGSGAGVGLIFTFMVNCTGGTCMLIGNPVSSAFFGALLGMLVAFG